MRSEGVLIEVNEVKEMWKMHLNEREFGRENRSDQYESKNTVGHPHSQGYVEIDKTVKAKNI